MGWLARWSSSARGAELALAIVLVVPSAALARAKPQLCPSARFVVNAAAPLVPGASGAVDVLGWDDARHVTLDGCGAAAFASVKPTKKYTLLKAKWAACGSLTKLLVTAKVPSPACGTLAGKLKAHKQKIVGFAASLSSCHDGKLDAGGGEECDDGHACGNGAACTDDCTCPPPTTTTTSSSTTTTVPGCVDADGDGWTTCEGDCCDTVSPGCPDPAHENPGAFDVPSNGVDDDCNGTVDDSPAPCDGSLASNTSNATDYAKALDLCRTTTAQDKTWGVISAQLLKADGTTGPAAASSSIRPKFGTNAVPQAGASLVVLSTGNAATPGDTNPSFVAFDMGQNAGTSSAAPSDWLTAHGGAFPNAPGCPAASSTTANDPVMLKLRVRVPTNARSFSVRALFYSAEFPEWVCTDFNDIFLVLLDSTFTPGLGETANPADKNLATYTAPGNQVYPVGVNLAAGNTGLFTQCVNGATGCSGMHAGTISTCVGTSLLAGTGFDGAATGKCDANSLDGGGTGWLTTSGNVVPGETIDVRFVIWDTGDHGIDSLVLLDGWTWSTSAIGPGTS